MMATVGRDEAPEASEETPPTPAEEPAGAEATIPEAPAPATSVPQGVEEAFTETGEQEPAVEESIEEGAKETAAAGTEGGETPDVTMNGPAKGEASDQETPSDEPEASQ